MLICPQLELALELAQEATSKGEKIFNIASIMPEIYVLYVVEPYAGYQVMPARTG